MNRVLEALKHRLELERGRDATDPKNVVLHVAPKKEAEDRYDYLNPGERQGQALIKVDVVDAISEQPVACQRLEISLWGAIWRIRGAGAKDRSRGKMFP